MELNTCRVKSKSVDYYVPYDVNNFRFLRYSYSILFYSILFHEPLN
jgi:hypothetical protein